MKRSDVIQALWRIQIRRRLGARDGSLRARLLGRFPMSRKGITGIVGMAALAPSGRHLHNYLDKISVKPRCCHDCLRQLAAT
jgi:hypothetical protein